MQSSPECEVDTAIVSPLTKATMHYTTDYYDNTTIKFSCIYNFHQVSGNMSMTCLGNGSWEGKPPYCDVDYFMEKKRLSMIIVGISLLIPCVLLAWDFHRYLRKRHSRRQLFARSDIYAIRAQRVLDQQSIKSRNVLQEAVSKGVFITASSLETRNIMRHTIAGGLLGGRRKTLSRLASAEDLDLSAKQKPKPTTPPGKVWYEKEPRQSVKDRDSKIAVFGAGRHLATVGKKFWDR